MWVVTVCWMEEAQDWHLGVIAGAGGRQPIIMVHVIIVQVIGNPIIMVQGIGNPIIMVQVTGNPIIMDAEMLHRGAATVSANPSPS